MIPNVKKISYEEFQELDRNSEQILEYVDGEVFMQASPSTEHQRISVNLTIEFGKYFKNKKCEVFHAPFDVELRNDDEVSKNKVVPDLVVICDKKGLNERGYSGVPTLIVEILSPSNQSFDLITKLNLYQRFGVSEYWIVNPKLKSVQIYALNEEKLYLQTGVYKYQDNITSTNFKSLKIKLNEIF